ncbi:hypothetical protein COT52_01580 [candidate division WWE3 bacterium CG08_land_8_20_14_0_20_43_13]|uniref:Nudix hydrolase domain-containing protein n=1 Tax=candidate division WWE3 bacterium CG08_land_8_20_14_0_20_43_13 TaxID=1975087 RepID=A0A2H0X7G2_UNCKA|nr:MAG: hypothetical protein COT52_01580 [candidate division WWE3 bacterium CG08_land_8_20_14_0_20_43_13]
MSEQILYHVDENDQEIGQISRLAANSNPDIIHRAVGIFVYDHNGDLLIQKRSSLKDTFPDCWDISLSGHVSYGDSYLQAAVKDIQEELGLVVPEADLLELGKVLVKLPWENEWRVIYRYSLPEGMTVNFPLEETSEIKFVTLSEVKEMLENPDIKWSDKARQLLGHFVRE